MGFFGVLQRPQTFAEKIGGGLQESVAQAPNLALEILKARRAQQGELGQQGMDLAKMLNKDATLEDLAQAAKDASQLSGKFGNPAEMQEALINQAAKRKNIQSRIEENIDPERFHKKITDLFTGESPEDRKARGKKAGSQLESSGMTRKKQRELLSKKLAPEEVEEIISPLSKDVTKIMDTFAPIEKGKRPLKLRLQLEMRPLTDQQREKFRSQLEEVFRADPNANPLLVRKKFEEKGVNWREFRDMIDTLQGEGIINFADKEDFAQIENYLQKPPVGALRKFLTGIKLVGR